MLVTFNIVDYVCWVKTNDFSLMAYLCMCVCLYVWLIFYHLLCMFQFLVSLAVYKLWRPLRSHVNLSVSFQL